MNIANVNRITGERVVLFDVEMTFGDVIPSGDSALKFYLCDKYSHSPLFEIVLNTKLWGLLVEELHYNTQIAESITKDDVDSIPNFIRTVKMFVMQIRNIIGIFELMKAKQDVHTNNMLQTAQLYSSHSLHNVSIPPLQSFSHLSGSLGQPINPNKKRFLSKATAKMPVSMSVEDDELW
jgi:hypothetical protein